MKILSDFKTLNCTTLNLKEADYTLVDFGNNMKVSYKNTDKSNNDILSDLLECKAYATALLFLNENYVLETGKFKDIFEESNVTVEDYYSDCNDLLNKNITVVEELGIPLTTIGGYKIFEGQGYILRGNGKKKIKESFNNEDLGDNVHNLPDYEFKALRFAEKYGIADYKVDGNTMIYYETHNDNGFNNKPIKYEYKVNLDTMESEGNGVPMNEEGTQVSDIAPKVDQDMNKNITTSKKKHYDILLSGLDEGLDILNKGFLKNSKGQYQRGNYILVKEGDKYLAVHKDKLKEGYENKSGQMSIDEKGLPELPRPYYMTEHNGKYYIQSSHPYDNTDYTYAVSYNDDINYGWYIYDYDGSYINGLKTVLVDTADGWQEALEIMQNLDSKKKPNIDKN